MIEKLVRKNISKLMPYTSARDTNSEGILLDANENSLGSVVSTNKVLELNRYPDPSQNRLRKKLSEILKINSNKLFFGVGSDEIIDLLIRIFCDPKVDSVLIPEPTYGMYKVACDINDVKVITSKLNNEFQLDVGDILSKVTNTTKIIFLCSPNNPTGNILNRKDVLKIVKNFNGIVVIDEAYIEFNEKKSFINDVKKNENLVITRTFSKAWGLAGIRCGYSISNKYITDLLFNVKAPYNLNKLTSDLVLKALSNLEKKESFVIQLNYEKDRLIKKLKKIDVIEIVYSSDANFILFKIQNATKIYNKLIKQGVVIRNRSNQINLQNCLRVSIGSPKENKVFIKKLKEVLCQNK